MMNFQLPPPKNWDEFEELCADLFSREWDDPNTVRHGRPGQRQNGVDIYGSPSGRLVGVQCKGKRQWPPVALTKKKIDVAVAEAKEFEPPLTEFIIVTTANDDVSLQAHARIITDRHKKSGLFGVQVFGWGELSRRIKSHDTVLDKHYGFPTISAIRNDIAKVPEQTVQLVTEKLRRSLAPTGTTLIDLRIINATREAKKGADQTG